MGGSLGKRDKPLRTYGKRPSAELQDEPARKRVKTTSGLKEDENLRENGREIKAASVQGLLTPETTSACVSMRKDETSKSSILSYFRPVAALPIAKSSQNETDRTRKISTPRPSSPPLHHLRKRTRLLRLKTSLSSKRLTEADKEGKDASDSMPESEEIDGSESCVEQETTRSALQDGGPSLRNQQRPSPDEAAAATRRDKAKPKRPPTVQMTLNISSQAPFSECKLCDTVWNPLYPDDVKYHSRRHATVLRVQRRDSNEL